MSLTATAMEAERAAKVAAERAKIEKADKAKLAKTAKAAKAERERVAKATAERKAKGALDHADANAIRDAKIAAKKKATKPDEKQRVTEVQLAAVVKNFAVDGATKSAVVKAVRQSGVSAKGSRIRDAYAELIKAKATKGSKPKTSKGVKVTDKETGLGITR